MKYTVERMTLVKMLRLLGGSSRRKGVDPLVRMYACAARVFVETSEITAGVEAIVLAEGSCRVHRGQLIGLLRLYPGRKNFTFEADKHGLRFGTTVMDVVDYSPGATPPAKFRVFPVTDDWLVQPKGQAPAPRLERSR